MSWPVPVLIQRPSTRLLVAAVLVLAALALTGLVLLVALVTLHELFCFVLQAFELAHNCLPPREPSFPGHPTVPAPAAGPIWLPSRIGLIPRTPRGRLFNPVGGAADQPG
jgi:hypothetical protein